MEKQKSTKNGNVPIPMIILFAVVAVALLAVAGYFFCLTYATLYTINGISVLDAPFLRAKGVVFAAAGIAAAVADLYLLRLRKGKIK